MKKKSSNLVKTPRRRKKINGIFILSKPSGMSSNQALQRVKRAFDAEKAGHTGSLDPMATGVLPICLGEATKFSQYLLDADKSYRSTFSLGIKTDTGDSDGEIVSIEDTSVLKLKPLSDMGSPVELVRAFGKKKDCGCNKRRDALNFLFFSSF